jgi:hypothetical protein
MTAESILEMTRRQPFEPFLLKVSHGMEYEIRHPDMVIPTHDYVAIPPTPESGRKAPERVTWVSILHVVELTPMEKSGQTENGQSKKK